MKPLFILPFDHRSGLTHELFSVAYPPNAKVAKAIITLKNIIFEGFLKAYPSVKHLGECGILVDEEFGAAILDRAKHLGISFAVSTEKSGGSTFDFIHGKGFGRALIARDPSYAKALVNYTIHDTDHNLEKMKKLRQLSEFCQNEGIPLMLEPLVHDAKSPLSGAKTMIADMHKHGVFPALWKLEMQKTQKDWKALSKLTRAPMILLGHGESKAVVDAWVETAAKSGVVNGFAIGRTIFFEPIKKFHEKKLTRTEAVESISKNYVHFVKLWMKSCR